jgi:hypothetical protein
MKQRYSAQVTLDGGGDGSVQFGPVPLNSIWRVERIVVDAAGTPDVTVYIDQQEVFSIVDFSSQTARNIADESQPIHLNPGEVLIVAWDGATAASVGTATIQVDAINERLANAAEEAADRGRPVVTGGFGGDGMNPAW